MSKKKKKLSPDLAFDALGNEVRRSILAMLMEKPHSVAEIAKAFPISRPAISRHLAQLVGAGLLQFKSQGTQNLYVLDTSGIEQTRVWLDRFWNTAEARLKMVAENTKEKTTTQTKSVKTPPAVEEVKTAIVEEEIVAETTTPKAPKPKKIKPRKKEPEVPQTFDLFGGLD